MLQNGLVLFRKYLNQRLAEEGLDIQVFFDEFLELHKVGEIDAKDMADLINEEMGFTVHV